MGRQLSFYDWHQIGMLAAFGAVLAARSALMIARDGCSPFTPGAGKSGTRRLIEISLLPGFALWIVVLLGSAIGEAGDLPGVLGGTVVDAEWARVAGSVLLAASVGLWVWALVSPGSSWRVGIEEETPGALVTTGVFGLLRNPIFASMDALFFGTFLIQGTVFFLAAFVIEAALTHFQILQEEAFLAREYGGDYRRYRERTPRYLGLPKEGRL